MNIIGKRAVSGLIDYGLFYALLFGFVFAFGTENAQGKQTLEGLMMLAIPVFWFIYFPIVEGVTGQTLGKKIIGLRLVKLNGSDAGFGDSILRHLFDSIDLLFFGFVAIVLIAKTDHKQRVGDLVAGTTVIEEKSLFCEKCHTELTLNHKEAQRGYFICPLCGHQTSLSTARL